MLAFLKRRWVLSLCTVFAGICSVSDWTVVLQETRKTLTCVGVASGDLMIVTVSKEDMELEPEPSFHGVRFGGLPMAGGTSVLKGVSLPVWLVFGMIASSLVARELRWRERREKRVGAQQKFRSECRRIQRLTGRDRR